MRNAILRYCLLGAALVVVMELAYFGLTLANNTRFNSWQSMDSLGEVEVSFEESETCDTINNMMIKMQENAYKTVQQMYDDGLLTKRIYNYLTEGIASSYMNSCAIIEYEQFQDESNKFVMACEKLRELEYDLVYTGKTDCTADECLFARLRDYYFAEDYRNSEEVEEAHVCFHNAVEVQMGAYELTEEEIRYYYELDMVMNYDYIENIEVELVYLPARALLLDDYLLNWYVYSPEARVLRRQKTLTIEDRDALEYLDLSNDAGLYDMNILGVAQNILHIIGEELENSSNELVILDITNIDNYEEYINRKLEEKRSVRNVRESVRFFPISITERYEGEQIYLLYDVKSCTHVEESKLPTQEEYCTQEWMDNIVRERLSNDLMSEVLSEAAGEDS